MQTQVREALQRHRKVVFFAHHQVLIDGVQHGALADVPHVRIDGGSSAAARHEAVSRFQRDAGVRAALVGITVGGTALTLTAASVVVFLELYWTPGALLQAEDRVHRIGQTARRVEIEYWLGEGTIDNFLWPLLQRKARVVGHALGGHGSLASTTALAVDAVRSAGGDATAGGAAAATGVVASRFFGAGARGAVGAGSLEADDPGVTGAAAEAGDLTSDVLDDSVLEELDALHAEAEGTGDGGGDASGLDRDDGDADCGDAVMIGGEGGEPEEEDGDWLLRMANGEDSDA